MNLRDLVFVVLGVCCVSTGYLIGYAIKATKHKTFKPETVIVNTPFGKNVQKVNSDLVFRLYSKKIASEDGKDNKEFEIVKDLSEFIDKDGYSMWLVFQTEGQSVNFMTKSPIMVVIFNGDRISFSTIDQKFPMWIFTNELLDNKNEKFKQKTPKKRVKQ